MTTLSKTHLGFEIPDGIVAATGEGLVDLSWQHDECPCFGVPVRGGPIHGDVDSYHVRLWVHHQDPEQRDNHPDQARFVVSIEDLAHWAGQDVVDTILRSLKRDPTDPWPWIIAEVNDPNTAVILALDTAVRVRATLRTIQGAPA